MAEMKAPLDTAPKPVPENKVVTAVFGEEAKNKGGRPPGSGTGTRLKPDTVKAAAVMDALYANLGALIAMTSDDQQFALFNEKTAALSIRNVKFFEADPKLAATVAKWGDGGGTLAFALANITTLAPFVAPLAVQGYSLIQMVVAYFRRPRQEDVYEAPVEETPGAPAYDPSDPSTWPK